MFSGSNNVLNGPVKPGHDPMTAQSTATTVNASLTQADLARVLIEQG